MMKTTRSFWAIAVWIFLFSMSTVAWTQHLALQREIPVGSGPQRAVITPNGAEIYVSNLNDNTLSVVSTSSKTVTSTITLASQPNALAVSPDGTKVYVGHGSGSVSIVSTASKSVTSTFSTPGPVRDLAVTPDGSKLYLAMEFSGLGRVLTATNALTVISSTICPEGVAVTPDGTQLFVSYQCSGPGGGPGHDAIGIFTVATDTFSKSITGLPNVGGPIAISPNGLQVWDNGNDACGNPSYDHVGCPSVPGVPEAVVNAVTTSGSALKALGFNTTEGAGLISFFPDSSKAFIGGGDLKVVDTASFLVTQTFAPPASGSAVFARDHGHAYAPITSQNVLAVLGRTAGQLGADFDGDGKADFAVWRPSTGAWWVTKSSDGSQGDLQSWGVNGDIPAPGDYDGDGKTDFAVWRPSTGTWWVVPSSTGVGISQSWGVNGDIPVPGDYDGDGKTDFAVWRPSTGEWWVIRSSDGMMVRTVWGASGDVPVPGDYDGDGKIDFAVWRPSTGEWRVVRSSDGVMVTTVWGTSGDIPVPGDYDGDGKTDLAMWRPSTGAWWVIKSSDGSRSDLQSWGVNGDIPVPGDYDGDGKTDFAVWRPSTGIWWVIPSSTGISFSLSWGSTGDIPLNKPAGQ